jgi:hypothetical protein
MSENYIKVLWTCGMGDACTNTTRPGTHEEYTAAGMCCSAIATSQLRPQPSDMTAAA